jgi:hypothetical protein
MDPAGQAKIKRIKFMERSKLVKTHHCSSLARFPNSEGREPFK